MALTLHVETARWRAMVGEAWAAYPDLIPVVKGNGYGFGRAWLAQEAVQRGAAEICVGTVYELAHVLVLPVRPIVLTPCLDLDTARVPEQVVLTVASLEQVEHIVRYRPKGSVVVKLASGMQRHGLAPHRVEAALRRLGSAGIDVHSAAVHPPLAGTDDSRRIEIEAALTAVPMTIRASVSHLAPAEYAVLRSRLMGRPVCIRLGTGLWHQDKASLQLRAKVLDVVPVLAGAHAGYHATRVPGDGTIVIVDAGTSHGVVPHVNGDSPFHYAKRRMKLVEPPHMHVSMAFVPNGDPCPKPGEEVDVQRPLHATDVDRVVWH